MAVLGLLAGLLFYFQFSISSCREEAGVFKTFIGILAGVLDVYGDCQLQDNFFERVGLCRFLSF